MSEILEEKYKYMCKMVEQMASSLNKAEKIIKENEQQGLTIQEYQEIKNKQIRELEEMVAGAQNKEQELYREKELLKDHIFGMCEMIYYQVPLRENDDWMDTMIEQGYYKKPEENDG